MRSRLVGRFPPALLHPDLQRLLRVTCARACSPGLPAADCLALLSLRVCATAGLVGMLWTLGLARLQPHTQARMQPAARPSASEAAWGSLVMYCMGCGAPGPARLLTWRLRPAAIVQSAMAQVCAKRRLAPADASSCAALVATRWATQRCSACCWRPAFSPAHSRALANRPASAHTSTAPCACVSLEGRAARTSAAGQEPLARCAAGLQLLSHARLDAAVCEAQATLSAERRWCTSASPRPVSKSAAHSVRPISCRRAAASRPAASCAAGSWLLAASTAASQICTAAAVGIPSCLPGGCQRHVQLLKQPCQADCRAVHASGLSLAHRRTCQLETQAAGRTGSSAPARLQQRVGGALPVPCPCSTSHSGRACCSRLWSAESWLVTPSKAATAAPHSPAEEACRPSCSRETPAALSALGAPAAASSSTPATCARWDACLLQQRKLECGYAVRRARPGSNSTPSRCSLCCLATTGLHCAGMAVKCLARWMKRHA